MRKLRHNFTEQLRLQLLWAATPCPLNVWRKAQKKWGSEKKRERGRKAKRLLLRLQQPPRAGLLRRCELLEGAALQRWREGGRAAELRGGGTRRPPRGQPGRGAGLGASRRRWPRRSGEGERAGPPAPLALRARGWAPRRELPSAGRERGSGSPDGLTWRWIELHHLPCLDLFGSRSVPLLLSLSLPLLQGLVVASFRIISKKPKPRDTGIYLFFSNFFFIFYFLFSLSVTSFFFFFTQPPPLPPWGKTTL